MTTHDRISKPTPQRDGAHRTIPPASGQDAPRDAAVHEVVAHAVRVGYQVIGDNIRQGKTAAERLSTGDYAVKDVPGELAQLSLRLLQLTRDMSTTAFDLIGAVLRDPTLQNAVQGAAAPAAAPAASSKHVTLTYNLRGKRHAIAEPGRLRQPDQGASLTVAGLMSPDSTLVPLKTISFAASPDGLGLTATIVSPDDQPGGTYSGVVCDSKTHKPLGTLTVQVMP